MTEGGRRQYHAMVIKLDKRTTGAGAARFNYTWSHMMDNQWGQFSTYGASTAARPQNYYDLDAEYSISTIDTPHRIVLSPVVRIPGPATRLGGALVPRRLDGVGGRSNSSAARRSRRT